MSERTFLDLPAAPLDDANVLLLPLPFENTTCYGRGTAQGPAAIIEASTHVELWDEECDFDLDALKYHTAPSLVPANNQSTDQYLDRVFTTCRVLHKQRRAHGIDVAPPPRLLLGVGGEHSLTPPLVRAAADDPDDLSPITVVQFDAHSDLRDTYGGTRASHACAMRRVVERGAHVIAIGIRSAEREEFEFGRTSGHVETFFAQQLAENPHAEETLIQRLRSVEGHVYLTFDIDALEVTYCPGTGTPQPGGLGWWQSLRFLRALLLENRHANLIGCDLVETALQSGTQVNEFAAARLLGKFVAYRFVARSEKCYGKQRDG